MAFSGAPPSYLDTLAYWGHVKHFDTLKTKYLKRARKIFLQSVFAERMIDLGTDMQGKYWKSWWCSRTAHIGVGADQEIKMYHRYCKQRWCHTCAGIRVAENINGYSESLQAVPDVMFGTVTWRNVPGEVLRKSILTRMQDFREVLRGARRSGLKSPGIRHLEITYNVRRRDFHPHIHFACSADTADYIRQSWIDRLPGYTHPDAQDIRPLDASGMTEIFKYLTPLYSYRKSKDGSRKSFPVPPLALDTIYRSLLGVQVTRPFGGLKKALFDQSNNSSVLWLGIEARYRDNVADWVTIDGEPATGYEPSDRTKNLALKWRTA